MDQLWISFWGSALGGSLVTALVAILMFFMNSTQAKRVWSRDLRARTFSEVITLMDQYSEALGETADIVIGRQPDEIRDAIDKLQMPAGAPGQFHLVADRAVRVAFDNWAHDAEQYCSLLMAAGYARFPWGPAERQVAKQDAEAKGMQWDPSNDEIRAAVKVERNGRLAAYRAMQDNLGLNAAYMLSEHR